MITSGEGKTKVWLEKKQVGEDLVLILGGGEKTHIGAVIMCTLDGKTQILKYGTHKDYIVLEPIAKIACEKYKTNVVATGGVHIENASKKEIEEVIDNCKRLEECI